MHPDVIPASVLRYMTDKDPDWVQVVTDGWLILRDLNEDGVETQRLVCRIEQVRDMHTRKVVALSKDAHTW